MAQLTSSATIKEIIASLQALEGINSKADLAALLTSWGCTLTGSESMADLINLLNGHIPNLISSNVRNGVSIAGVTGSPSVYGPGDSIELKDTDIGDTLLKLYGYNTSNMSGCIGEDSIYAYYCVNSSYVYMVNKNTGIVTVSATLGSQVTKAYSLNGSDPYYYVITYATIKKLLKSDGSIVWSYALTYNNDTPSLSEMYGKLSDLRIVDNYLYAVYVNNGGGTERICEVVLQLTSDTTYTKISDNYGYYTSTNNIYCVYIKNDVEFLFLEYQTKTVRRYNLIDGTLIESKTLTNYIEYLDIANFLGFYITNTNITCYDIQTDNQIWITSNPSGQLPDFMITNSKAFFISVVSRYKIETIYINGQIGKTLNTPWYCSSYKPNYNIDLDEISFYLTSNNGTSYNGNTCKLINKLKITV